MKAAVCYEFGQPLVVEEVDIDPPQLGEVKVRMVATGICHSDLHLMHGDWGGTLPMLAGHEGAGIVDCIGLGVTRVKPGDHVVVSLLRSCGCCEYCDTGMPHLCSGKFALQDDSRLRTKSGKPITQGLYTGAFAEYVIVDQSQLVIVPDAMPLESAALLACGVITGLGAVVNRAQVRPGSSVVVIGVGGVGLNSVQGAHLAGAHPIIAVDVLDGKLDIAKTFGATHVVNSKTDDLQAHIAKITNDRLADFVFVTTGVPAAAAQAYDLAAKRGMVVFVGIPNWTAQVSLPIASIVVSEKMITGSAMGSTRLNVDVPRLVALYEQRRLKLDELITARYSLAQINEAIRSTESGIAVRNVILFDQ